METEVAIEAIERAVRIIDLTGMLQWIDCALQGYCIQYYFGCFLEIRFGNERLGKSRFGNGRLRPDMLTGLLVVTVALLEGMVRKALAPEGVEMTSYGILWAYGWQLGFLFLTGVIFYRVHYWKTLFVILTFCSVYFVGGLLVSMELLLDDRLRGVLGDWLAAGRIPMIGYAWLWVALSALYSILNMAVLYWLLRRIVRNFREKEMALQGKEILQLVMPSLTGLCLHAVLEMQVYGTGESFYLLFGDRPFLCILVSLILFFSLLSIICGVAMFQDVYALNRERKGRAVLEKQISALQEYVGERERIWFGLRGLKHDMRNTLSVAMRLAEKGGESEKLQAYLDQLNLSLDAFETEFRTGNVVADALLEMKCHEARKRVPGLKVDVEELVFPGTLVIQDYDIGVILGNALDNAVEACERLRKEEPGAACRISLSAFLDGEMFLMEIKNTFDGKMIKKEGKEFPETRKADGESHGIGISNIKSTCEKYHGAVEWTAGEEVFVLSVMLCNRDWRDGSRRE